MRLHLALAVMMGHEKESTGTVVTMQCLHVVSLTQSTAKMLGHCMRAVSAINSSSRAVLQWHLIVRGACLQREAMPAFEHCGTVEPSPVLYSEASLLTVTMGSYK